MKTLVILLIIVLLAGLQAVPAQERFVKPVDEAKQEASFLAFRSRIIQAAERKDAKYIISILDPAIKVDFGGGEGIADFRRTWRLDQRDSKFWGEFLKVIKNGGTFIGGGRQRLTMFAAPYNYTTFPDDLDGFEYASIFGSKVNLREGPSLSSKVVGQLSYNVVKVVTDGSVVDETKPGWFKITTLGGKTGYVNADYVRSPIDYRAGFEKKRGQWKMIFFIAGD